MAVKDLMQTLNDRLAGNANAKAVYGEPIETHGRTLVPVARVQYAFGCGAGNDEGDAEHAKEGSGGGGGVRARPVGVIEADEQGTRFVPIIDSTSVAMCIGAGLLLGLLLRR